MQPSAKPQLCAHLYLNCYTLRTRLHPAKHFSTEIYFWRCLTTFAFHLEVVCKSMHITRCFYKHLSGAAKSNSRLEFTEVHIWTSTDLHLDIVRNGFSLTHDCNATQFTCNCKAIFSGIATSPDCRRPSNRVLRMLVNCTDCCNQDGVTFLESFILSRICKDRRHRILQLENTPSNWLLSPNILHAVQCSYFPYLSKLYNIYHSCLQMEESDGDSLLISSVSNFIFSVFIFSIFMFSIFIFSIFICFLLKCKLNLQLLKNLKLHSVHL